MRTVFLGSPPFATPILRRLVSSRHRPVLCVTPPARPRGRGRRVEVSPVAELAREHDVALLQPESVRDEPFLAALRATRPDVFLVASYGELLRQSFLDLPREVTLNVHPSLLPRHRGATPVPAAILAGDRTTGVSIQRVVLELDAGDVLLARETEIGERETAGELAARLAELSGELVLEALDQVAAGEAEYRPQDPERVTFCKRLTKDDGRIDWTRPAAELDRHVRAMNPWPLAHTLRPDGTRLVVQEARPVEATSGDDDPGGPGELRLADGRLLVSCAEGALELLRLQSPGKRAMAVDEWLRGARLADGERWGGEPA